MNLLVISHTPHIAKAGKMFGWGPTVKEINFLALKADSVTHIAPVVDGNHTPESYAPVSDSVKLVPVRNRGGAGLLDKIRVLIDSYQYAKVIVQALKAQPDSLVHVRCPANISLVALLLLMFFPFRKKWIKYAGDWHPHNDYLSNRFQRLVIRHFLSNHIVTINGYYPGEKKFIHYFLNPSFTIDEVKEAARIAIGKDLGSDFFRLLFVGALEPNKGADIAIESFELLTREYPGELILIGDGSEAGNLGELAKKLGILKSVQFAGWKTRDAIKDYLAEAHFIILPSKGEGWPKAISEAMAYGVVPVVSDVSGVRHTLTTLRTGTVVNGWHAQDYFQALAEYLHDTSRWRSESQRALEGSSRFTLEFWWERLNGLIVKMN